MEPDTNASITSGDAPGSICPQGWTLPPNAGDGSYYNLLTETYKVGSDNTRLVAAPFDFAYTGIYNYSSGALGNTGDGYYWSRTAGGASYAYDFYFYSGGVVSQNSNYRGYGFPVRCVGSKLLALPLEFGYTGIFSYSYGYLYFEGLGGGFWSRTTVSGVNARYLSFNASSVSPQHSDDRGVGRAVCCRARNFRFNI